MLPVVQSTSELHIAIHFGTQTYLPLPKDAQLHRTHTHAPTCQYFQAWNAHNTLYSRLHYSRKTLKCFKLFLLHINVCSLPCENVLLLSSLKTFYVLMERALIFVFHMFGLRKSLASKMRMNTLRRKWQGYVDNADHEYTECFKLVHNMLKNRAVGVVSKGNVFRDWVRMLYIILIFKTH